MTNEGGEMAIVTFCSILGLDDGRPGTRCGGHPSGWVPDQFTATQGHVSPLLALQGPFMARLVAHSAQERPVVKPRMHQERASLPTVGTVRNVSGMNPERRTVDWVDSHQSLLIRCAAGGDHSEVDGGAPTRPIDPASSTRPRGTVLPHSPGKNLNSLATANRALNSVEIDARAHLPFRV